MSLAPITEEEKPHVEAIIKKLVRYRKRVEAHSKIKGHLSSDLTDAITSLQNFGGLKGWWPYPE